MIRRIRLFLLLAFILLLSGCSDEWNDLVDSISGSGDDNPAPKEKEVAAAPESETEQEVTEEAVVAILQATDEAAPESEATEEAAAESEATEEAGAESEATSASEFHHTTTASSDGGKSLVMCPGHVPDFDKCSVGDTDIPFHGYDNGRVIYWNMFEEPRGDIICIEDGKSYRYRADSMVVYGSCG